MLGTPADARLRTRALRWFAAVAASVVLALAGVLASPLQASAFDEGVIHGLVNQSRAANGLGPLSLNASLSQVAAVWANQMAANGQLSHNPNYSAQIPGGWTKAAENVAQGYPTGAAVHQGWIESPDHRANILGDFTDIGIAHISAGGTTWSVEVFAKYGGSVPAVPAPQPPPPPAAASPPQAPAPEPPATVPEPSEQTSDEPSATPTPSETDADTPAESPQRGERAEDGSARQSESGSDGGNATTKLVLGIALLASIAVATAGWLRMRFRR